MTRLTLEGILHGIPIFYASCIKNIKEGKEKMKDLVTSEVTGITYNPKDVVRILNMK